MVNPFEFANDSVYVVLAIHCERYLARKVTTSTQGYVYIPLGILDELLTEWTHNRNTRTNRP